MSKSRSYQIQFLMYLDEEESKPLREAQTHAMEKSDVSLQTAKRLTREMSPYLLKEREGRSFQVTLLPDGVEFLQTLIDNPPAPPLTEVTSKGIHLKSRIPRDQWSEIMRQTKSHNLATAFVPQGCTVTVTTSSGETYELDTV